MISKFNTILVALAFPMVSHAVVYHPEVGIQPQSGETQFWGQISTVNQWSNQSYTTHLNLDPSPQHTAQVNGQPEWNVSPLSSEVILANLAGVQAEEFAYSIANERDEKFYQYQQLREFPPQDALVFEFQYSKNIQLFLDPAQYSIDQWISLIQAIDQPHNYQKITADFAHNVIEPTHSGHQVIEQQRNNADSAFLFSTIRLDDYQCSLLKNLIATMSEVQGESVVRRNGELLVDIFNISTLRKITGSELDNFTAVFQRRPDFVLAQETFYNPRFVKDLSHYWAFFKNDNGSTTVASYSAIATSTKFRFALSVVLEGPTKTGVLAAPKNYLSEKSSEGTKQLVNNADAVLDSLFNSKKQSTPVLATGLESRFPKPIDAKLVDLNAASPSNCSAGLSGGLAYYTHNLFEKLTLKLQE